MSAQERFIPIRTQDLLALFARQCPQQGSALSQLGSLVQRHYHQLFFAQLNDLKSSYQSLDPDSDLVDINGISNSNADDFLPQLRHLLERGNFEQITAETLQQALQEESLFKVRLEVDFDYFEEVLFFYRGEQAETATIKSCFGLKRRQLDFSSYKRVAAYVKFKEQKYFDERDIDSSAFKPGTTLIKLFKNVPKADLEMLFPNAEVRMKTIDKLLIGGPALVGGGVLIATKLGATLLLIGSLLSFWMGFKKEPVSIDQAALVSLAIGLGALAGHLWKQFSKFKNRKIQFMKSLSENLYFKNLDNNAGVFHYLSNMAEEEECKEVLLAYFILSQQSNIHNADSLDSAIEAWLKEQANLDLDFEIDDALDKLKNLGLAVEINGSYSAISLDRAIDKMHEHWQSFTDY